MSDNVLHGVFDALGEMRTHLRPSSALFPVLKGLLSAHFRSLPLASVGGGPIALGPFGSIDLPYRKMGAIDSIDLFGLDELLIFAFYWANRKRYRRTLDVGANIGLHSIMMGRAGFDVIAFEPDPVHFELLQANLSRNAITAVSPRMTAISDKDGQLEFVRVVNNTTGSHLAGAKENPYGPLDRFQVPVQAFGPLAAQAHFAKIDAEGHEVSILKSVPFETWARFDAMVEIGTPENAAALFEHFKGTGVNLLAQKIGWEPATRVEDLPTSHREGSMFVTRLSSLPWGNH